MSEFDDLVADVQADPDWRPVDTEDAVHLLTGMFLAVQQLGFWDVLHAMKDADEDFAAIVAMPKGSTKGMSDEERNRLADRMGDAANRFGKRINEWLAHRGLGPMYIYILMPCCETIMPLILNDGGPVRFFDPDLDEMQGPPDRAEAA